MTVDLFRFRRALMLAAMVGGMGPLHGCTGPVPAPGQDAGGGVRAFVDAYEKTWNTHEPSAVAAFFSEDADFIVGNGPRIVGRAAVEKWWRSYFSGIDDARRGTFAIASLRAVTPDVVLINIDSTTAGRDGSGRSLPTRVARGTWLVARDNGKWQISAFRALPAEGDVRSGPGRDRQP
jgi:uncharacterized protein (TIGR02246 family)